LLFFFIESNVSSATNIESVSNYILSHVLHGMEEQAAHNVYVLAYASRPITPTKTFTKNVPKT
jgi:hypothetical protein